MNDGALRHMSKSVYITLYGKFWEAGNLEACAALKRFYFNQPDYEEIE